jgi:uncharacterized protein YjbI with pentapeptide repeats
MLKNLGSKVVIIALVMGVSPVSLAETTLNGNGLNGIKLNGNGLNGVKLNGNGLNGNGLNGIKLNGIKLNGNGLNGVKLNGKQSADARSATAHVTAITLADGTQLRAR